MTAVLGWLATYLLHSTVLLAAAWVVDRLAGRRRPQLAETVWRCAVLGALLTASLQTVMPLAKTAAITVPAASATPDMATLSVDTLALPGQAPPEPARGPSSRAWLRAAAATAAPALGAVWLLGALLASIRLASAAAALHRLLRTRTPRPPGRTVHRLAHALGVRRAVAVSTSRAIPVPFTTGVRRPEVCCPERLMTELAPRLQAAILAHELAHVARRDVAWRRAVRGLAALLWLQPLNHVARRRLEALGETLCDRRAATCTGRPHDLAACLVEVAAWAGTRPLPLAAMAPGRELDRRVHDLLEAPMSEPRASRWTARIAGTAVVAAGIVLPAVSWTAVPPAPAPPAPVVERVPAAPVPESPAAVAPVPPAPATAASPAAGAGPRAPSPAQAPAPAAPPSGELEDAIVEALMTKAILDPAVDQAEVRRVVAEVMAREAARHERDIERRAQERVERDIAARQAEAETRAAKIERRVRELVERDLAARQADVDRRAAELAVHSRTGDSRALEARAAALEEQAQDLAEQQDKLREQAQRLAEEAARLREQQSEAEQQ